MGLPVRQSPSSHFPPTEGDGCVRWDQDDLAWKYWDGVFWQTASGGSGAPTGAKYVTLATDGGLSQERVLVGQSGVVSITDGGAGNNVEIGLVAVPVTLITNMVRTVTPAVFPATHVAVADDDYVLLANPGAALLKVQLPAASAVAGRTLIVKKVDGTGNIQIDAGAGDTIDGAISLTWTTLYQSFTLVAPDSGGDWAVV